MTFGGAGCSRSFWYCGCYFVVVGVEFTTSSVVMGFEFTTSSVVVVLRLPLKCCGCSVVVSVHLITKQQINIQSVMFVVHFFLESLIMQAL